MPLPSSNIPNVGDELDLRVDRVGPLTLRNKLVDPVVTRSDSLYESDYHPLKARELSRSGANVEMLARAFNVSVTVVEGWMARHPDFLQAVKDGRKPVDVLVEDALLQAALGGVNLRETTEMEEDGPMGVTKRVVTRTRTVGGDVAAQKFWLANRKKEQWGETDGSKQAIQINIGKDDSAL